MPTLIELVIMALLVWGFVRQVAVPLVRGTPMFPRFSKEHRLRKERAEVEQERIEAELEDAIAAERERLRHRHAEKDTIEAVRAYRLHGDDAGEEKR